MNNIFTRLQKIALDPVFDTIKTTSENLTITFTETSIKNNKALENLNNRLLEKMNDRRILSSYLLFPLSKITKPQSSTQFRLVKDSISNRVNDLLIKNTIPITLHDNLLTSRDTGKVFELNGVLLKMITNKNYNVGLANLANKNLMYNFAKGINFDVRGKGNKSTRDRTLIKLLKSPGLTISASGISNTIFLPSDPHELCDRLNLLLQEIQAGKISDKTNEESIARVDNLIEYNFISKKQHKQILTKCNLLHEQV